MLEYVNEVFWSQRKDLIHIIFERIQEECLSNTIQVTALEAGCHGKAVSPLCIEFSASAGFERVCGISRDSMSSLMNGVN